jgi:hypothetical protein
MIKKKKSNPSSKRIGVNGEIISNNEIYKINFQLLTDIRLTAMGQRPREERAPRPAP